MEAIEKLKEEQDDTELSVQEKVSASQQQKKHIVQVSLIATSLFRMKCL